MFRGAVLTLGVPAAWSLVGCVGAGGVKSGEDGVGPGVGREVQVEVEVGEAAAEAGGGRLLLFLRAVGDGVVADSVDANQFFYRGEFLAGREVDGLKVGERLRLDGDDVSFPASLDELEPGEYWVQAVLDVDHSYAYSGRGGGDVVSGVGRMRVPPVGAEPELVLGELVPTPGLFEYPFGPMFGAEEEAEVLARVEPFAIRSGLLSGFMGRAVEMRGFVVTPAGYDGSEDRYPVVYFTDGFTSGMTTLADRSIAVMRQMREGVLPPMVWVFLDQSCPGGTHEFADSVNNGPWGSALVSELIPAIEGRYRTDGVAGSRFVTGHSSGGWAALWLQLNHGEVFGGAWATAPDFCDFRDYWGVDITAEGARMESILWMAQIERVMGEYGGQLDSFEWVFSPRGEGGRPMELFDRSSGAVDGEVARYWREHWDLSELVRRRWDEIGPDVDGKVRVIVGEEDEAGLDDSAKHLEAAFEAVGGRALFRYVPGKGHFDLYSEGDERQALRRKMVWEMWRVARPGSGMVDPLTEGER